ncbi:uncharacterized protein [Paramisgurnus dabryanus]|uniref:uncharacterized protein isoform X4 n=1 Tax=Paramisgurnus dabryanus TaxID=90735 RepID=UPI0031F3675C
MTKILSGSQRVKSHYFCKKNILKSYERVIGAVLENKNHWTLFFCDLTKQEVTYLDSFGETNEKKEKILKNWSSFAKAKGCILEWKWNDVPHPRQDDGHSCGIHVLMFAQALLDGKGFVDGYSSTDIPQLRAQLCYTLFSSLDRSMKCTVCWGVLMKDKPLQSQESKQTEGSTRVTPDDQDQQGGEKKN